MNPVNKHTERGQALSACQDLWAARDSMIQARYPITIYPPIDAALNAQTHHHQVIELIVNFRGASGAVAVQGCDHVPRRLIIGEQQCCLIPAGICHSLVIENRERNVSLFVDESVIATCLGECVPGVVIQDLRSLAWGDPFTGQLIHELNSRDVIYGECVLSHSMLTTLAVKLIDGFVRLYDKHTGPERGLGEMERTKAHTYIEERLEQKFCVSALAKHMGMSLPHLNRRFRVTFGCPPLQYALKLRVDKALALLRRGDARVADAAFAVGFCDQSHFDRHCRKFYGFPPSAVIRATR